MNYVNYIYNKIKIETFEKFRFVQFRFLKFRKSGFVRMHFGILGVFHIITDTLNIGFGFIVFFRIYEDILKIFLETNKIPEVLTILVRNIVFEIVYNT